MIKKRLFRFGSVFMCAALMACSLAACGPKTASINQDAKIESQAAGKNAEATISDAILSQFSNVFGKTASQSVDNSKEETVYVFTDANGRQDHLIINENLKNVKNLPNISDFSTLDNIQNLTGDETSTKGSNNKLEWSANGNSITYQGTSSKTTPVTMKVTYYLDGKEISASDLAGKSGKVTIHYDYTNNEKKTVNINGTTKTIYVPFTMITGLMLPTDKFSNIQVTNGKLMEYNDGVVAMGVTVPGLKDSLKMQLGDENLNLDIPESFEITADVTDFELEMSMSVASSNLLSDVNLDSLNLDSVNDDVDTLSDASNQLADGAGTLSDNLSLLNDKVPDLTAGVSTLDNAASALQDATAKLSDGAATIKSGASDYTGAVAQLADGSGDLVNGTSQAAAGINALSDTVREQMVPGIAQVKSGLAKLSETLSRSFEKINDQATTYGKNTDTLNKAKELQNTIGATPVNNEVTLNQVLTSIDSALEITAYTDLSTIDVSRQDVLDDVIAKYMAASQKLAEVSSLDTSNPANAQIVGTLTTINSKLAAYHSQNSDVPASLNQVYINEMELLLSTVSNKSIAGALMNVYSTSMEATDSETGMTLSQSLQALNDGVAKIQAGIGSFEDVAPANETLCSALFKLQVGSGSLKAGSESIQGYLTTLADKNDTLNGGLSTLAGGTSQLASSSVQLKDGTSTLNSSADALGDAVGQLSEGALTLKDGMIEFNETGVQKLADLLGTDSKNAIDTLKAVVNAGKDYQSFAGKSDDMTGSVQFIYKTDEITK